MATELRRKGENATGDARRETGRSAASAARLPLVDAPALDYEPARRWRELASPALAAAGIALAGALAGLLVFPGMHRDLAAPVVAALCLGALMAALPAVLALRRSRKQALARELMLRSHIERLEDRQWELRESEELYRGLAETFGDAVVHRDARGLAVFANEAAVAAFGPGLLAGGAFEPVVVEEGEAHGPEGPRERRALTTAGPRWYLWFEAPAPGGFVRTIARDITELKQAAAAQEQARLRAESDSRAKSRFLATVSHEMRTPLNGILGMSDLLADTALTPEQAAYANAIGGSGRALLGLIEDILDFAMIEAGRFAPRNAPFSPARMVEEACELMAARAHAKGLELACRIAPDAFSGAVGDCGRLRQVLLNLVGNAVKFTARGGVEVRVERIAAASPRLGLRFRVIDTGPGLREQDLERVFGEFEQADNAATRAHGGAGLGLAISRGIVESLGGRIGARSRPGEGSEFWFEVELAGTEPEPAAAPLRGDRVLVVSPGAVEGRLLAEAARDLGGRATHARTLGEASKLLRAGDFDTLVLDPAVSRDCARSLSRLLARARRRPFCAVLLRPSQRNLLPELLASGFDAWLIRPVRRASLASTLGERRSDKEEPVAPARRPLLAQGETLPRLEVLLAEDNPVNALLARTALQRAGQDPELAADGRQALAIYRRKAKAGVPVRLVLMDLHMPVMDGLAAIRAIRRHERRAGLAPARILTLSADDQHKSREDSARAGADGFLTKPVAPAAIVDLVRDMSSRVGADVKAMS